MSSKYTNALGRRKCAVAKIFLKSGSGNIEINGKKLDDYFNTEELRNTVRQPLILTNNANAFDIKISVSGGGITGQAQAIRLSLARALVKENPELKKQLKAEGYLTRDARVVERKKYGQAKARKRYQFSKR